MVWFDCECGESLKKPSVAKHFQQRRCGTVTCVDCSTVFKGNEFEGHIKCISEAQKYMGKLYQADSGKREGGKQDDWMSEVLKVLEEYKGPMSSLVQRLKQYDNIPRKQKAFENFVANSLNLKRDPHAVTQLWNLVSACMSKPNAPSQTPLTNAGWSSFEQESTEMLQRNGGQMPWKNFQSAMTKRRKTTHPQEKYEDIRLHVLANVPEAYLSAKSNLISLA